MSANTAPAIEKTNFEAEVLQAEQPVLVYFWATWCSSCKAMSPRVNELAGQTEGRFKVAKVEVSANEELAEQYNIMSLPTMLLFKPGETQPQEVLLSTYVKDWASFVTNKYLS